MDENIDSAIYNHSSTSVLPGISQKASSIILKDSTKALLCVLEELQRNSSNKPASAQQSKELRPGIEPIDLKSSSSIVGIDDCSVYKRLTRKCHCLNHQIYNDFMIHFNENTKYFTSTLGEIIKNVRIIKKFLYIGGDYTKHAFTFLNEGLTNSTHIEKVEITQACAHADVCNVFDDNSMVVVFILWPCVLPNHEDAETQALAASFLNKLARLEEGRRYLKFSSKITSDLKKVIRTKAETLETETLESLTATLDIMLPPLDHNTNFSYYCKPVDEGFGSKTVTALLQYRQYMTLEEIFTHLDLLHNLSTSEAGKQELSTLLQALLGLFKHILLEYDNSEMNIIVSSIINNVSLMRMTKSLALPKTVVMADTATEPIKVKHELIQFPPKSCKSMIYKSQIGFGMKPNKTREMSKSKGVVWDHPVIRKLNKSKKFSGDNNLFTAKQLHFIVNQYRISKDNLLTDHCLLGDLCINNIRLRVWITCMNLVAAIKIKK